MLMGLKLMPLPEDRSLTWQACSRTRNDCTPSEAATIVVCPSPYESLLLRWIALEPPSSNPRPDVLVDHSLPTTAACSTASVFI